MIVLSVPARFSVINLYSSIVQVPIEEILFSSTNTVPAEWEECGWAVNDLPENILSKCIQGNNPIGRWYITVNGTAGYLIPDGFYPAANRVVWKSSSSLIEAGWDVHIEINLSSVQLSASFMLYPCDDCIPFTEDVTAEIIKWTSE